MLTQQRAPWGFKFRGGFEAGPAPAALRTLWVLHPKVVANVAPRSSCTEATGLSLTHSSVFLRTCPSMGSSTRDDDGAGERRRERWGVCAADSGQGRSTARRRPPPGGSWSSGSCGYLLRFFCRVRRAGSVATHRLIGSPHPPAPKATEGSSGRAPWRS
jgi:hypothetical protein